MDPGSAAHYAALAAHCAASGEHIVHKSTSSSRQPVSAKASPGLAVQAAEALAKVARRDPYAAASLEAGYATAFFIDRKSLWLWVPAFAGTTA